MSKPKTFYRYLKEFVQDCHDKFLLGIGKPDKQGIQKTLTEAFRR